VTVTVLSTEPVELFLQSEAIGAFGLGDVCLDLDRFAAFNFRSP
jgi:hypothetical protein